MSFLSRLFGTAADRSQYRPLYEEVVRTARDPAWYREGAVPDSLDGRFDMIAATLALVLLRLEKEGKATSQASVMIAELFIEDMDGSIRQMGIGDLMVGKHVGKMMSALGGRLTAFRDAIQTGSGFDPPVRRNVFHDTPPSEGAVAFVAARLESFHRELDRVPANEILAGAIPTP